MSNAELAIQLFFQIALILGVCHLVGQVAKRCGQPQVIAEMIAGILLGPSLLGLYFPDLSARLFPADSMKVLYPFAQAGLVAYMFVVGMELRVDIVRQRMRSAVAVSVVGMIMPFVLGLGLGWFLLKHTALFPANTSPSAAMLFLGASMCVTALPVMARIVQYKKLNGTAIGAVSLGAGAIDDTAAWAILALVLATLDGDFTHALRDIGGGIAFVVAAFFVLRPVLQRWARGVEQRGELSDGEFMLCLAMMAGGAWLTEITGMHAVLGAFVIGAIMPRGLVADSLIRKIEPFTVAFLLPLFFTYSGLNTQMGLLNSWSLWLVAAVVLVLAVAGKGVACWLAARATGLSQRDAIGVGTLMNTRGLMELIIINIGLQRGVISPALFTILAIMAVVTTLMTSPLFDLLVSRHPEALEREDGEDEGAEPAPSVAEAISGLSKG